MLSSLHKLIAQTSWTEQKCPSEKLKSPMKEMKTMVRKGKDEEEAVWFMMSKRSKQNHHHEELFSLFADRGEKEIYIPSNTNAVCNLWYEMSKDQMKNASAYGFSQGKIYQNRILVITLLYISKNINLIIKTSYTVQKDLVRKMGQKTVIPGKWMSFNPIWREFLWCVFSSNPRVEKLKGYDKAIDLWFIFCI